MRDRLLIRYEPDPSDEAGQLWFDLRAGPFSGLGSFWSNTLELDELIEKLACYPLEGEAAYTWGYRELAGDDIILALRIWQIDVLGHLRAHVVVADYTKRTDRVLGTLNVTYAAVTVFRDGLVAIRAGLANEAVLAEG